MNKTHSDKYISKYLTVDSDDSSDDNSDENEYEGEDENEYEGEDENEEMTSSSSSSSSSSSDSDSDSETKNRCSITKSNVMPELKISCLRQHMPDGKKCFKNECLDLSKLISITFGDLGNIVQVRNSEGDTYIVKWNVYKYDVSEFKMEVKIQKMIHTLGLAPQILQIYEQKISKSKGGYVYMFMTDIVKLGYKSISEYFGTFNNKGQQTGFKKMQNEINDIPEIIIKKIALSLKKIHSIGVTHGEVTPANVFTNGNNILFMDFGSSELFGNSENAWKYEQYSTIKIYLTAHGVRTKPLIPNNWHEIKRLSKP